MISFLRGRHIRRYAVAFACTATVSTLLLPTAAQAKSGAPPKSTAAPSVFIPGAHVLTAQQVALLVPTDQEKLLDPLRAIAAAVDQAGQGRERDIYSTLKIDAGHDAVDVYVTEPAQAGRLVKDALNITPSIDTRLIVIKQAPYTLVQLHAARDQILAQSAAHQLPYTVNSVAVATDGSSVQIGVDNPTVAEAGEAKARLRSPTAGSTSPKPGVVHTFVKASPLHTKSWSDVKWHDSTPFIGGDVLTDGSTAYCTAGLPAVRISTGARVMITANHCFSGGTAVYTGAGTPGNYMLNGASSTGNYVGTVTGRVYLWDAEELEGANNNADESDTSGWIPLTSIAYSYNGDYVCHDGARSFFLDNITPCGIEVTNQDITWPTTIGAYTYNTRGVEGYQVNGGWGVAEGDSGGTVFTISGTNSRQARGIVSAGGAGDGNPQVAWTEAPDIFKYFGLELNPQT